MTNNTVPQLGAVPITAAVYARISRDDRHDELGVRRQQKDCRAMAERKGWSVTEVFVDDDVSAYVPGKRPAYSRLLDAIRGRAVDAVAVYDLDRLHRHPRELETFFEACDGAGLTLLASVAGDVDLSTNDGRCLARIMGAVAKKSSDDTSRRLRRKFDETAEAGLPHGGRAFGYEPDGVTVREGEAVLLRQATADVLAGESLAGIARRWNAAGVVTPQRRRPWEGTTVKTVLTGPRQAGLRVHRGQVIGPAAWPAIVDRATHERLVAALNAPSRRAANPPRRQPFTGVVRCGRCGGPMSRDVAPGKLPTYRCHRSPGRANCGGTSISATPLEALVTAAVFLRLDSPELAAAAHVGPEPDNAAAVEMADVEARLTELAEMFAAGEVTRGEWMTARNSLEARLRTARAAASRQRRTTALDPYAGQAGALRSAWPDLSPDLQRAVLAAVIDRVLVNPATRRGPRFDPDRVDVGWRV